MPLITMSDFLAPAPSNAARKAHELVVLRVQDRARPMPPDPTQRLSDASIALLQGWWSAGAKPGAACAAAPVGTAGTAAAGGASAAAGAVHPLLEVAAQPGQQAA